MRAAAIAVPVLLLLAACEPVSFPPMRDEPTVPLEEPETMSGTDADVTPEPFAEALEPLPASDVVTVEERSLTGGVLELGAADAPGTMKLFLNVESAYAREFERARLPRIIRDVVATGDMKVRVYLLPIDKYTASETTARSLSCAADAGKGYPALRRMMDNGRALDAPDLSDLDIDAIAYAACTKDGRDPLATARTEAAAWNVTLVPTYVVNGTAFVGLPTAADLRGQLRDALR